MTSPLRALWLLLLPSPLLPGQSYWNKLLLFMSQWLTPLFVLPFIIGWIAFVSHGYRTSQEFVADGVASVQINEFTLHQKFLASVEDKTTRLDMDVALIGPVDMVQAMAGILESQNVNLVDTPCQECMTLEWFPNQGWFARYIFDVEKVEEDQAKIVKTQTMLLIARIREGVGQQQEKVPAFFVNEEQAAQAMIGLGGASFRGLGYALLLTCTWLLVVAIIFIGIRWDLMRATGRLEPWAVACHHPWVMYLSQIIKHSLASFLFLGIVLLAFWVFDFPLAWKWVLSVWLVLPFLCLVVGQWGIFSTVLFHHPRGRMFARLTLSPIVFCFFWSLRLFSVYLALRWRHPIEEWKIMEDLNNQWMYIFLAIPLLVVIWFVLFKLTNWRIGPRREGMRKTG